jgi:16S rRNA (cytosine967-C5)-methyltransferase
MRSHSHLNSAVKIIGDYKGNEPLSAFLKKYFSVNKKFGSRDRKQVAHLCYCFFRLGKAIMKMPAEERMFIGLFLCSTESNELLEEIRPKWNLQVGATLLQKLSMIPLPLLIQDVFPWKEQASNGLNHEKFCESFFIQPNLYLRIRPGYEQEVKDKLLRAGTSFTEIEHGCLSLSNATKIEDIIDLDKEAVVQDLTSQQIAKYLQLPIANCLSTAAGRPIHIWDSCAGSGGKSLLLYDRFANVDLTVSDIRESIIANLKKRFAKGSIKKYHWFVADLTKLNSQFTIHNSPFDVVICDAPCTGSGTWSRTPEQLYFFDERKIDQYAFLQRTIVTNTIPHLKHGGLFVYITCSVFKKENEDIVHFIEEEFHGDLIEMKLLKGYEKRADSMFVSIFRKTL